MKFKDRHAFEKDSDSVIAMFTDREYFERKYAQTAISHEVLEHESEGEHFRIKCKLTLKSEAPLPGFAKKLMGDTMQIVQEDVWDRAAKTGRLTLHIVGAPVDIHADMDLGDEGGGAVNTLDWEIKCAIPLVGGKLEKFIAGDIQGKSDRDVALSNEILQDY